MSAIGQPPMNPAVTFQAVSIEFTLAKLKAELKLSVLPILLTVTASMPSFLHRAWLCKSIGCQLAHGYLPRFFRRKRCPKPQIIPDYDGREYLNKKKSRICLKEVSVFHPALFKGRTLILQTQYHTSGR